MSMGPFHGFDQYLLGVRPIAESYAQPHTFHVRPENEVPASDFPIAFGYASP